MTGVQTCALPISAALVPLPDAIDDRTAAAVMMQGLTASHFATDFYPVQPGDVALVHAAAGGVGLPLTQIIKLRGGRVIGRVSRQKKVHAAIEAGADHVIVGTEGDFADEVIRLSGATPAQVSMFFACGMLANVTIALGLDDICAPLFDAPDSPVKRAFP